MKKKWEEKRNNIIVNVNKIKMMKGKIRKKKKKKKKKRGIRERGREKEIIE